MGASQLQPKTYEYEYCVIPARDVHVDTGLKRNANLDLAAKMGREFRCRVIGFIPLLGGYSTRAPPCAFDCAAFCVFFNTLTAFCEAISLGRLNTSPDMALASANFLLFP